MRREFLFSKIGFKWTWTCAAYLPRFKPKHKRHNCRNARKVKGKNRYFFFKLTETKYRIESHLRVRTSKTKGRDQRWWRKKWHRQTFQRILTVRQKEIRKAFSLWEDQKRTQIWKFSGNFFFFSVVFGPVAARCAFCQKHPRKAGGKDP